MSVTIVHHSKQSPNSLLHFIVCVLKLHTIVDNIIQYCTRIMHFIIPDEFYLKAQTAIIKRRRSRRIKCAVAPRINIRIIIIIIVLGRTECFYNLSLLHCSPLSWLHYSQLLLQTCDGSHSSRYFIYYSSKYSFWAWMHWAYQFNLLYLPTANFTLHLQFVRRYGVACL